MTGDSITDLLLRWWLLSGRGPWSRFHRSVFERKYLVTALPPVNSLEDIEASLKRITWAGDGPLYLYDCISYPQTTWAKAKDDCDGFAILAAELLSRWSPDKTPVLLTAGVRPVAASHTVCVFKREWGDLGFFDNDRLRIEGCQTYAEIVARISGNRNRLVCWDVKDPATLKTLEFHRA
jgi:hypothetical protein